VNLKLGGRTGYWLLRALCRRPSDGDRALPPAQHAAQEAALLPGVESSSSAGDLPPSADGNPCELIGTNLHGAAKLQRFLGSGVWKEFCGARVLDFGCGEGSEAVAVALRGAELVVGVDILEDRLESARCRAERAAVAGRCVFLNAATQADELHPLAGTFDCAYSIDAFEHYADPASILETLHDLLAPGGRLLISFGPPWHHPYGCHLRFMSPCPWIHWLFREETIMAVRALHRRDGARRFGDVPGGLNQMTLRRFLELVAQSPFKLEEFRPVPLSSRFVERPAFWQRLLTSHLTREFLTSVVVCHLVRPQVSQEAKRPAVEAPQLVS
jgi:SAM-dependent methyltransferase